MTSMKIRCQAGSIRLRLRKSDIEALNKTGAVQEEIMFAPGQSLIFELALADVPALSAMVQGSLASVRIPRAAGRQWIDTEQVGLEGLQDAGKGQELHILIEKDFPCKHQPMEDKSDTFQELA